MESVSHITRSERSFSPQTEGKVDVLGSRATVKVIVGARQELDLWAEGSGGMYCSSVWARRLRIS